MSHEIEAAVRQVYEVWVSSDTVIPPATAMEVDPRVGGAYRFVVERDGHVSVMQGEFRAVRPLEHIEYRWEWNRDGRVSVVRVDFNDLDAALQAGRTT